MLCKSKQFDKKIKIKDIDGDGIGLNAPFPLAEEWEESSDISPHSPHFCRVPFSPSAPQPCSCQGSPKRPMQAIFAWLTPVRLPGTPDGFTPSSFARSVIKTYLTLTLICSNNLAQSFWFIYLRSRLSYCLISMMITKCECALECQQLSVDLN